MKNKKIVTAIVGAWILWARYPAGYADGVVRLVPPEELGKSVYKIIDGFETAEQCNAARAKLTKTRTSPALMCLPSDVDPRK